MITLASIIERFEVDYLAQYPHSILPSHRKALEAMKLCRSRMAPRMPAQCSRCDDQRYVPHSCGHRNCPHCQHFESQFLALISQGGFAPCAVVSLSGSCLFCLRDCQEMTA
jgi:hypothetical protein